MIERSLMMLSVCGISLQNLFVRQFCLNFKQILFLKIFFKTLRILNMSSVSTTKKYSKYTREMRIQLIRLVDQQRLSTAHAARIIGIKQTSACRIMRSYHLKNKIFERKADRLCRLEMQGIDREINGTQLARSFGEENRNENNQTYNGGEVRSERLPLVDLSANIRQNMGRQVTASQQNAGGESLGQNFMSMSGGAYVSMYYPGMYPMVFNYFM